jgi:uncharacterized protein (TIGR02679 family)
MTTGPRLPPWIADPRLRPAWERIRARFEKAGLQARGIVVVPVPTREERHALGALLGRSVTRESVRIDLAVLDARLRERADPGGLRAVLTDYFGAAPQDRPTIRAARDDARERPLALAAELVAAPWADGWIAGLRRTGLLTRVHEPAAAERIVRDAAAVLAELCADRDPLGPRADPSSASPGTQSRVELAARLLGDAHALDRDRLLHRVVLRGLAAAAGEAVPEGARDSEEIWARFGVEPDLLSRTCLVWRVRIEEAGPLGARLRAAADVGDPVHITEWDLRRSSSVTAVRGQRVLVCENPAVVEALAQHGVEGWGAVCTAGEPNLVVDRVLAGLSGTGAVLHYHGDFDWPGIAIANRAVQRYGARPWRMGAEEYVRAVRGDGPILRGGEVEPLWDPELGAAMRGHRRVVHEESVLTDLLDALAEVPRWCGPGASPRESPPVTGDDPRCSTWFP